MTRAECLTTDNQTSNYLGNVELKFQGREVTAPQAVADNASNNLAIQNGGMSLSDLLKKEMGNSDVAARASGIRRRLGQAKQTSGIAKIRLSAGMSQQQVAEAMGVQQPAIARWERHPAGMSAANMLDMATALKISMGELAQTIAEQLTAHPHQTRLENA